MKRLNKKGFTMAELLIVVAIIAVLVAIAIPVFTTQLEKARKATDLANIRSSFAEATAEALTTSAAATAKDEYKFQSNGLVDDDLTSLTGELGTDDAKTLIKAMVKNDIIQVSVDADGKVTKVKK